MNMKRVIIIGTMIVTMSFAGTAWGQSAISPIPTAKWSIVDLDTREGSSDEPARRSESGFRSGSVPGTVQRQVTEDDYGRKQREFG